MIRISFLLISIISLIYGLVFLLFPGLFIELSSAELVNVAWLRSIGASVIGLLFFGCFSIYYNFHGKLTLLKIITLTSILQTLGLIYSRFYNEFSAKKIIIIDLTIYLAIFISIYFAYLVLIKSYKFR